MNLTEPRSDAGLDVVLMPLSACASCCELTLTPRAIVFVYVDVSSS